MEINPLCSSCQKLIIDDRKIDIQDTSLEDSRFVLGSPGEIHMMFERWDTYPDLPYLQASAEQGCSMCSLLRIHIRNTYEPNFTRIVSELQSDHDLDRTTEFVDPSSHQKIRMHGFSYQRDYYSQDLPIVAGFSYLAGFLEVQHGDLAGLLYDPVYWPISFKLAIDEDDPIGTYLGVARQPFTENVFSEKNIGSMRKWIDDCISEHPLCQAEGPPFVPTRLLYVGDEEHHELRLILTAVDPTLQDFHDAQVSYAALSYCWGDTKKYPPLETRDATLQSRLKGIPFSEVPPTIQDAVTVTRKLKLQYLWIDALCILQGNAEDWQKESATMTQVYGHAYVTIAAAVGNSSHSGFLGLNRNKERAQIPCHAMLKRHGISGHMYLSPTTYYYDWSDFEEDIEVSTWNKRAWTFQERNISRRVLYFGKKLYFQCQSCSRIENLPKHIVDSNAGSSQSERIHKVTRDSNAKRMLYKFWRDAVRTYSSRALSYESDRLPAISGVAHHIADITSSEYLAGLWQDDLLIGLLWSTDTGSGRAPRRPEEYLAPSWSWVSCGATELYWLAYADEATEIESQCEIIDVQTTLSTLDPMGRVNSGYIILRGKVEWLKRSEISQTGSYGFDYGENDSEDDLVCAILLIRVLNAMGRKDAPGWILDGLLLRKAEEEGTGKIGLGLFRRVGAFEIVDSPENIRVFRDCSVGTVTII